MAIQIKLDLSLQEANTVNRALEVYRDLQLERVMASGGPDKLPGTMQEVGRVETILSREFGWGR